MEAHVGGQHHGDHQTAELLLLSHTHLAGNVALGLGQDLEGGGGMMVLQGGLVIVQQPQVGLAVDLVHIVGAFKGGVWGKGIASQSVPNGKGR